MKTRRDIWLWATALTAAVLLCGACVKLHKPDEGDDGWVDLGDKVPISFSTTLAGQETKSNPLEADFRVFAFYQPGVVNDDPAVDYTGTWNDLAIKNWTSNFMYNQEVNYSAGSWSYSPVKYWPNNPENTITFWAYSPSYGDEDILKLYKANSAEDYATNVPGAPEIKFTTNGSRDLLVSELAEDLSYRGGNPGDGVVSLVFNHTMTWVDFAVKKVDDTNAYTVKLKSITLQNVCKTAIYTLNGWGNDSERDNFTVYDCGGGDGTVLHKDEGDRITFPTSGTLLLIPQTLRNTTATLQVVYTLNGIEYTESVLLGNITTRWEEGKHYTYKVNISPGNSILFTAVVAAWDAEQNGYFSVNE